MRDFQLRRRNQRPETKLEKETISTRKFFLRTLLLTQNKILYKISVNSKPIFLLIGVYDVLQNKPIRSNVQPFKGIKILSNLPFE